LACLVVIFAGCSKNTDNIDTKVRSVNTNLTKQSGLEHWRLALIPKINSLGKQEYDIEFQNSGDTSVKSVTIYYRVDTKEKLLGKTVKADFQTMISKLDANEKITLSDLTLPINTPIQVEVDWLVGSTITRGTGTFQITEFK
jgi:hypothetical protein